MIFSNNDKRFSVVCVMGDLWNLVVGRAPTKLRSTHPKAEDQGRRKVASLAQDGLYPARSSTQPFLSHLIQISNFYLILGGLSKQKN